ALLHPYRQPLPHETAEPANTVSLPHPPPPSHEQVSVVLAGVCPSVPTDAQPSLAPAPPP
ncbi:hypothetical protein KUCAC02_000602, partial [Chaenocephalus aceratus]